jgi:hypothetical protein
MSDVLAWLGWVCTVVGGGIAVWQFIQERIRRAARDAHARHLLATIDQLGITRALFAEALTKRLLKNPNARPNLVPKRKRSARRHGPAPHRSADWKPATRPTQTRRPHQTRCGSSFGKRMRLKAALAKTKSQSTFGSPRSFTFRIQAIVFSHPNAGSIRGRAC